jgi:tetratricopeptide (TPR) repeat protein
VKKAVFALIVILSTLVLVPGERQMIRVFQRSVPHPEMEGYFERRLAQRGDEPDLLRELIRIRKGLGKREGEVALRERLRAADPADTNNLENLVLAYVWGNRTTEAFELAGGLLKRFPERRDLREMLLELAEYSGRGDEAHRHALWLLERGIRNPRMVRAAVVARDARMLSALISSPMERSRALVAMGAQKEAMDACLEHLRVEPRDFDTRLRLALLYRWNNRSMDAAAQMEEMLQIRDDPAIRKEILAIYRGHSRIDLMLPYLPDGKERADILLALGRVDEARALYWKLGLFENLLSLSRGSASEDEEIQVREAMPMTAENRKRLADLYAWKKEFRKALALYVAAGDERAVDLYLALGDMKGAMRTARSLGLHLRLGDLYLWSGDIPKAIVEYELGGGQERELARLYLQVGRKADALRLLDRLEGEDPWILAELFVLAGGGDRALKILRAIDPTEFDARRVEMILQSGDLPLQAQLYRLLLERDPGNEKYLAALVQVYEWMEDREGLIRALRELLAIRPNDPELCAKLGLMLNDRALLERAARLGSREPRIYRMLADLARTENRPKDAVEYYRTFHRLDPGDAESHFALAELTGDPSEYALAWSLLQPGDRKIRLRILIWKKDWEAAIVLLKEEQDWATLVDVLFELKRFKEAANYPLTVRQRALVAYHLGRFGEAVGLLRKLDLKDPAIRTALGDSLFALGRWREAEEYASPDLKKHIDGTYGPESSADVQFLNGPQDRQMGASARYRMALGQPSWARMGIQARDLEGQIEALSDERSERIEQAEASVHVLLFSALKLSAGGGGWRSDSASEAGGTAEIEVRQEHWNLAVSGVFNDPWADTIRTAVLGATRHAAQLRSFVAAVPQRLLLSGSIEGLRYESQQDLDLGLDGEQLSEMRARGRIEFRLLSGEGKAGQYFYDLRLRDESVLESHLGISAQADYSHLQGSEPMLAFTQLAETTEMITFGPTAGIANGTWGLAGSLFVGLDPARDLPFGKLYGGSAGLILVPSDGWRLTTLFDYVSESRTTIKGATWSATVGLNTNF